MQHLNHIVVGGSGFIGSHLREKLVGEVLVIDKREPESLSNHEQFIKWDIRTPFDKSLIKKRVNKDTTIHHLAAVHFDFQTDFFDTNVDGTDNVISAFSESRSWIFYSSVATYGDGCSPRCETSSQIPTNDYGKSKLEMEKLILNQFSENKLEGNIVIIRPGVVYGENNFGNVFNLMLLSSRFLPIGLSSNPIKSMAYVGNLVASSLFAMNQLTREEIFIYNYVDYDQLGTKDLLREISRSTRVRAIFIPLSLVMGISRFLTIPFSLIKKDFIASPMRVRKFAQPTHFLADKIRSLGFVQPIEPKEGISRTMDWIRVNDVKRLRARWKSKFKE